MQTKRFAIELMWNFIIKFCAYMHQPLWRGVYLVVDFTVSGGQFWKGTGFPVTLIRLVALRIGAYSRSPTKVSCVILQRKVPQFPCKAPQKNNYEVFYILHFKTLVLGCFAKVRALLNCTMWRYLCRTVICIHDDICATASLSETGLSSLRK